MVGARADLMDVRRLRLITVVAPLAFLLLVEVVSLAILHPLLHYNWVAVLLIVFSVLAVAAVSFSWWVFAIIERQHLRLNELNGELTDRVAELGRARDELQAWNEVLEARVVERTHEIQEYSQQLTTRVLQAQEDERKRIARELHDETAQSLSTLMINLDLCEALLPDGNGPLTEMFARVRTLARRTLDETRALSHDLRPTILDDVGLAAALQWLGDEYPRTYGFDVDVDVGDGGERLSPEIELALFRIAQEALTNAGRHAHATHVRVELHILDGTVRMLVEDNGVGFDPARIDVMSRRGGLGLYGMQERAALLGGTLRVETALDKGTAITAIVPLPPVEIVSERTGKEGMESSAC